MKSLRIFVIACLMIFVAVSVSAQETLTESITTEGGLSVQYPAHWMVSESGFNSLILMTIEEDVALTIEYEIPTNEGEYTSAIDGNEWNLLALSMSGAEFNSDQQTALSLPNGDGFEQPFIISEVHSTLITLNLADGTFIFVMGNRGDSQPFSIQEQNEILEIVGSISVDRSLIVEDVITDDTNTEVYIPEGAVVIADMPEGVVQFENGIEFDLPEGWMIYTENPYIESSVTIFYGTDLFDYTAMIVISTFENSRTDYTMYRESTLPFTAMLYTGHDDFDMERDQITETLDDGRVVEYLNIPEGVSAITGNFYFLSVNDELWANYIATIVDDTNAEALTSDIEAIVLSTRFVKREVPEEEVFIAEPLDIAGIDPSAIAVVEADCYRASDATEDAIMFLYQCPAGCANNGGTVWGTDIYTFDSAVCVAAIHSGITTDSAGGDVLVIWEAGQDEYISSTRNNVSTSGYGSWGVSFILSSVPADFE